MAPVEPATPPRGDPGVHGVTQFPRNALRERTGGRREACAAPRTEARAVERQCGQAGGRQRKQREIAQLAFASGKRFLPGCGGTQEFVGTKATLAAIAQTLEREQHT